MGVDILKRDRLGNILYQLLPPFVTVGLVVSSILAGETKPTNNVAEQQPQPTKPQSTETQPTQRAPKSEAAQAVEDMASKLVLAGMADFGPEFRVVVKPQLPIGTQNDNAENSGNTSSTYNVEQKQVENSDQCVKIGGNVLTAFSVAQNAAIQQGIAPEDIDYESLEYIVTTPNGMKKVVPYKRYALGQEHTHLDEIFCADLTP